tara:strand:+ start:963 stop:1361 length:399 start_codon:yes stop_codon:yes gene_type:complete
MNNFDLNILNYTIKELKVLFGLKKLFSEIEITKNTYNMKKRIFLHAKISPKKKTDIINFISMSEEMLKNDLIQYNKNYITIPKTETKPDKNRRYINWPMGASVLYIKGEVQKIYTKTTIEGDKIGWNIFKIN